jgi:hypothetical protein
VTHQHLPGRPAAFLLGVFLLLVLIPSTPLLASTIVFGNPNPGIGDCFPFGCNYDQWAANNEYQQVYSNTLFSGPITITGLEFYNTQANGGATGMNTGTFTIDLSTTSANWNTLSTTPASNLGGDNTQVFSGSLAQSWAFGDTLSIVFSTPFSYTPGVGANLLMDVVATGTSDTLGDIHFDVDTGTPAFSGNTYFGQYYDSGSGNVMSGWGLVTGFDYGSSTTPEPATLLLLGAGLAGLSLLRKRVRR